MCQKRSELQQEVVDSLVKAQAVNFKAVSDILSGYAERAATTGVAIGIIINWRLYDICIPPDPYEILRGANLNLGAQSH